MRHPICFLKGKTPTAAFQLLLGEDMLKIVVEEKGVKVFEYQVKDSHARITVGRSSDNEIQIKEPRSSREHCIIEKGHKGYKLIDLESANGTRVNGQMVNTKALDVGDAVQIGETTLKLVHSAPARPAVAVHHKAPERSPRPVRKPEKAPTRDSGRTPHVAAPVKKGPPWELFYIAGGLIVVLVIGTAVYNHFSKDAAITEALGAAQKVLVRAGEETETSVKIRYTSEALGRFRKIVEQYPDSNQAATARRIIRECEGEYKVMKKWAQKLGTLRGEIRLLGGAPNIGQLSGVQERIREFTGNCPYVDLRILAEEEGTRLDASAAAAIDRLFTGKKDEIDLVLNMEEYGTALKRWNIFIEDCRKYPQIVTKAEAEVERVKKKAINAFDLLKTKGDELIDQKRYNEARILFRNALKKFQGTVCTQDAYMKLGVIRLLAKGMKNRDSAEAEVASRENVYRSAAQAADAAKQRDYTKAIDIYKNILKEAVSEDVVEEFSARVKDLKSIQALVGTFRKKAQAQELKFRPWKLGEKTEVFVTGADKEWVRFSIAGSEGSTQKRWKMFSDSEIASLLRVMPMDAEQLYALGVFCLTNNLVETGEKILVESFNALPALIDRINPLIARMRDTAVPHDGFVPYKNRWYTAADRDRVIETERVNTLIQSLRTGSIKRAEEAFLRLKSIASARALLVRTLGEKREQLKKRISGNLQFNNSTLVALKNDLDKKRAHALAFIEDPKQYPDKKTTPANIYRLAQKEVDLRVKEVTKIWKNPYSAAVQLNPAAKSLNKSLKKVNEWLASVDKGFDKDKADKVDMDYIASLANKKLSIKTFATTPKEQKLIAYNIAVNEWNEKNKEASQVERRQVAILNEYRWMLGRRAVKIEEMLVRAARSHSAYMDSTGKWGHVIEGHPHGATPRERCKKFGYTGGTSENISKGHTDAMGTHIAWYNSAGHHRNMINRNWLVLGAGLKGIHWTQNFGSSDTTLKDKSSPRGGGWPGTALRGGSAAKKK
jgi:uncharacterized protein YkwD